jgi:amino acid adenylation domain-containing protein
MKGLARTHRVTLNTVVQGAWSILLSRYSGEQDVVFGAVLSGRPPDIPGVESIVGLFVNTLPARMNVDGDAALIPWLQALQLDQATMRQYEYSSLMQVRAWSDVPGGQPLFHTALAFQNYLGDFPSGRVTPDLQVKELETLETSDQPLTLQVVTGDTLTLNLVYDIERFDRAAIERMLTHCRVLLEGMAAHPQARLKDLPILTDAERQRLLVDWNDTAAPYPTREVCLHQLIDEQAGRTPDQIAVVFEQQALTYGELNRRANQLAHHLQALGVEPDVLVGLFVERSLEMLVGIVGILKAGGAYVPIDPDYPKARIGYLLEDSKASIVLTQEALVDKLPSFAGQSICLDGDWADIGCESGENPVTQVKPENLAYVLFTSGSTGRPKGVALEHRAAVTFVQWAKQVFTPRELAAVLFSTSVCFDLSVFEMFVTLSAGGKIVLAKNAVHLPSLPEKDEVTLINTVPSAIAELLRMGAVPASVKTVNLAGEALSDRLVEQIYATTHVEKVYNLYGPTEATTYSTYALVRRGCPVTIGRPVAGTQCYILDTHRNPVPIGVVGELYLGGGGLARGYYARPELTDERFVPNPFSEERGGRMYRTGDLCRWLTDGNIEYLGRGDHQVKLRGFRIELGEIEAVIAQHPAVREVAVIAREDAPGDKRLVAYLVAESPPADLGARLRSLARTAMPEYMVPAHFVRLAALPRTHNGKLDRKALPAPSLTDGEGRGVAVAPRTPTEEMVAGVFRGVLDRTDFGVFDNFFDLGGHSLMAARIVLQLRVASGRDLPLRVLFERQTVSEVAEAIDALAWLASSGQEPAAAGNRVEIEL